MEALCGTGEGQVWLGGRGTDDGLVMGEERVRKGEMMPMEGLNREGEVGKMSKQKMEPERGEDARKDMNN